MLRRGRNEKLEEVKATDVHTSVTNLTFVRLRVEHCTVRL